MLIHIPFLWKAIITYRAFEWSLSFIDWGNVFFIYFFDENLESHMEHLNDFFFSWTDELWLPKFEHWFFSIMTRGSDSLGILFSFSSLLIIVSILCTIEKWMSKTAFLSNCRWQSSQKKSFCVWDFFSNVFASSAPLGNSFTDVYIITIVFLWRWVQN